MSPPASFLNAVAATAGNGRAAAGVDDYAFTMTERGRHSRIPVAAGNNECGRPNLGRDASQILPVFFGATPGKKDSGPADLPRKLLKNRPQPLGRGKAEI